MSDRYLLAVFEHEDDILAATKAVKEKGLKIVDIFTPYAVHGLDRAMGLKFSRLTWVCFIFGMTGVLGMLWFEHWVAAVTWPIDVGGKPWNSLPSDVPVAFEAGVLLAAFSSVFALFGVSRLFPGKKVVPIHPRVTDDRFVMVLDEVDASFDLQDVTTLLEQYDVVEVEQHVAENGRIG